MIPAQFYAAFRGGTAVRGEKRLMLAVLQDALDCYQKYAYIKDGQGRQLFEEANEWVNSGNRVWFFSFENICETLGINPEYLRRGLETWRMCGVPHEQGTAVSSAKAEGGGADPGGLRAVG